MDSAQSVAAQVGLAPTARFVEAFERRFGVGPGLFRDLHAEPGVPPPHPRRTGSPPERTRGKGPRPAPRETNESNPVGLRESRRRLIRFPAFFPPRKSAGTSSGFGDFADARFSGRRQADADGRAFPPGGRMNGGKSRGRGQILEHSFLMADSSPSIRRRLRVEGIVQGVGFRPFVHRQARAHDLTGFVRNAGGGVQIEVQGSEAELEGFMKALRASPPSGTRIDLLTSEDIPVAPGAGFAIRESEAAAARGLAFAPDAATCADCLAEVEDPSSRWFGYPFTSCSACGPRFTIAIAAPFDRKRTAMQAFAPCAACRADYEDPAGRRFHAQTIACPACGPRLALLDAAGSAIDTADPVAQAAAWVGEGRIGALKGLGGFHLFCDATNPDAVETLRRRKRREAKPLAVMVGTLAEAKALGEATAPEADWLESPARPIVLLRHHAAGAVAPGVSAGLPHTGVMLPSTALHFLLLKAAGGRPLVMTSGNAGDEPTLFRDDAAVTRLGGIADFFLTHDREIHSRCDDSVVRLAGAQPILIRRARGYAPAPRIVRFESRRPTLAAGAQLKATFALGESNRAIVGHHLGDLDDLPALAGYESTIGDYERLFRIVPERFVHDLHPDYASTRYAIARANRESKPCVAVQHHHAHLAACLAENGFVDPALGVCFDGTGYGTDGAIWGGEFLVGGLRHVERAAHLKYVAMPGGEIAIREPWRMAAAYLTAAGLPPAEHLPSVPPAALRTVGRMIAQNINSPPTSSAGRFFDAMAALLGLRHAVAYEGQAAMELEALALGVAPDGVYEFAVSGTAPAIVDLAPTVRAVARDAAAGADRRQIAARIHATLAAMIEEVSVRLARHFNVKHVALTGGVFMNAVLLEQTHRRLSTAGFQVLLHARVPPNDGGISLGQLAVAAAQSS